jgi:hypothetical protein
MAELAEPLTPPEPAPGQPEPTQPPPTEWRTDTRGRDYIPRRRAGRPDGRQGNIIRQGDETIEQAIARDSKPRDERPRRKPKRPKMPEAPRKVDLKELEQTLAEALKAPAMMCATFGDDWAAEHFTRSGPYLARNLILASEHNPWLRARLEEAAAGGDAMMKLVSLVGVGGALFAYSIPPIVYWFNLPVPEKTREMFGIPPRRERTPAYAAGQNGGLPDEPAQPAQPFPA